MHCNDILLSLSPSFSEVSEDQLAARLSSQEEAIVPQAAQVDQAEPTQGTIKDETESD